MSLTLYVLADRRGGWRVEVEGRPISDAGLGLRCAEDVALRYLLDADEEGDSLVRDAYDRIRSYRHVTPKAAYLDGREPTPQSAVVLLHRVNARAAPR